MTDIPALLKEVEELPNPCTNLLTHNERELIGFCQRLGAALQTTVAERDDWRKTAKDCGVFVAIHAIAHARDNGLTGLAPSHFDLMTKLGLRMIDFKRASESEFTG